jgi:WD40-like Beta Propeller Repeat
VLNVAATSASLQAKIDPQGSETTYRFEYGTSEAYGSDVPVPDGLVGSGSAGVTVSAHPQGLSPSTTYHYRVVALVASRSETVPGSDGTFTTQPAGGEFALPDGRQWELVSPPNKHGALFSSLATAGVAIQAAEDGGGVTYGANVPSEVEPSGYGQGGDNGQTQILSVRGPSGWSSRDIAPPHNSATRLAGESPEYQFFSSDLSLGLADPGGKDGTLLSALASEPTPYIRRESLCDSAATASECYLPLVSSREGFADVPAGTKFGGNGIEVRFEGASRDLSHVLVEPNGGVALTPTPVPAGQAQELYEWSAGAPAADALQLVSVLPASEGGGPVGASGNQNVKPGPSFGVSWSGFRHAISDDGSRVFWESTCPGECDSLYVRDTVRGETVRLDVQQPGVSGGVPRANFEIASSDGSKAFFTDPGQRLTAQSGTQGTDLYECEIVEEAGRLKCRLTDLTSESGGQSAEVVAWTVLGASEDGSYVYFMANGVLGDGAARGATRGTCESASEVSCNLYEYHNGAITFVATLSADDKTAWDGESITKDIGVLTSRVSPDGRYLAFMSQRSLTGYDNLDAVSGKPDQEVYLYDAVTGHLACASCNPTGSRPTGVEVGEFDIIGKKPRLNIVGIDEGLGIGYTERSWVAANIPHADELGAFRAALYQPRALSDSGRLFFDSNDALVPQDVNRNEDVYEFEPVGVGSCAVSSVTFDQKSDGCVSLISSGSLPEESGFLDASANGSDVFFLTASRLTSQDYDTSFDVYDAHACTVTAPCVSSPVSPLPCSSGDSCKGAPSLQPSVFGAPASATFVGAGNVPGTSPVTVVSSRSLTRAQHLARALRECRKQPKRKRAACERQARRRYAAKGARRASGAMRKARG